MAKLDPVEVRKILLDIPKRQDIVLGSVNAYNCRVQKALEWIKNLSVGQSVVQSVSEGLLALEKQLCEVGARSKSDESDISARIDNYRLNSGVIFWKSVLVRLSSGESVESVLAPMPVSRRVSDYSKLIEKMQKSGLVVDVTDRSKLCSSISSLADYQIVVLGRAFEVPDPFSRNFLKHPVMSAASARRLYLDNIVETEIMNIFGFGFDLIYEDMNDPRYADARKKADELRSSKEFVGRVDDVLSDLLHFKPFYLIPGSKSRGDFEDKRLMPDDIFARRFGMISLESNYLTLIWRGFDKYHPKITLFANNSSGMRIHLYSKSLARFYDAGVDIDKSDITRISKAYVHGCEGRVLSRSGFRENYDPFVSHIADVKADQEGMLSSNVFSAWPDLEAQCHCPDSRYIGKLHRGSSYDGSYFCAHTIALYEEYVQRALKRGSVVLSPIVLPLDSALDFEQKVLSKVLVQRKEGGFKTANRCEREFLQMRFLAEKGYFGNFTTDVVASTGAYRRILFGK